jgi:hypothetical protein
MCGRLWSSALRRRFGERCPECEADAAPSVAGGKRIAARDADASLVGSGRPVSSSPGRPQGAAAPAER